MSVKWKTPGVQIEEVSTLPTTIVRESQTVPLFIGYTWAHHGAIGFNMGSTIPTRALRIGSVAEFEQTFGAYDFVLMLKSTTVKGVTTHTVQAVPNRLLWAIRHYFANGGGPCKVISCSNMAYPFSYDVFLYGLQEAESTYGCSLLVMPELAYLPLQNYREVVIAALAHAKKVGNRFVLLDAIEKGDPTTDASNLRANVGTANLAYGAAYYPHLKTNLHANLDTKEVFIFQSATVDGLAGTDVWSWKKVSEVKAVDPILYDRMVAEINAHGGDLVLPPSAAVAGQIVKTDRERGVWKAPANISLSAVIGPHLELTLAEQENYNVQPGPGISINVIRSFQGRGTVIWGARTMDGNSNEWRYVPVRRLFTQAEEAIKRGSEWAVFEPNNANTWLRLKSMIEIYLTGLWRAGALVGGKPQEAFFVRVGLGTTMTPQDVLEGILRIEVGMAAVRPAEFIVLRIAQQMQQS